jgi:hypothetical protein
VNDFVPAVRGYHPRQIHVRSPKDWVWLATQVQEYVDYLGRSWRIPIGFSSDLCSTPRPLWPLRPPSIGLSDLAPQFHDFLRRCRRLLGLSLEEIDLRLFYDQIIDTGRSRRAALVKSRAVYLTARMGIMAGDGLGWYGTEDAPHPDYDSPVIDEDEGPVTLARWVVKHYWADGRGWGKSERAT